MIYSRRNIYLWAAGLLILLASCAVVLGSTMAPRIVEEKEFLVIGIEIRTNT